MERSDELKNLQKGCKHVIWVTDHRVEKEDCNCGPV